MRRALVVLLLAATAACSGGDGAASVPSARAGAASEVRPDLLPAQFAALNATLEDVAALEKEAGPTSYLASTRLWALRAGERLRATLQVSTFVADSEPGSREFQESIVSQISESRWKPRILSGQRVYVTSVNQQPAYIWVKHAHLFVLSIAKDHHAPRGVLREALEVQP